VRTGIRSSAIIIKGNKILLIHRVNNGEEYWVFPGGAVEDNATPEETVAREVNEETGLNCVKIKFAFFQQNFQNGNKHPFYLCSVKGKEIKLGGPEAKRNFSDNWYNPEWIDRSELNNLLIYPEEIKEKILQLFNGTN